MHDVMSCFGIGKEHSGVCAGGEWVESPHGGFVDSVDPSTGDPIARVHLAGARDYERVIEAAQNAFPLWQRMPVPKRGEVLRRIGDALRRQKDLLGWLITREVGKIFKEGCGEVQEMIDINDFAVGLSKQMCGKIIPSERAGHIIEERWDPLGVVGIIDSFNFPVAVRWWNSAIAAVCGNTMVWKPSLLTPLCAIAVQNIVNRELDRIDPRLKGVFNLVIGKDQVVGERLIADSRIPLVSFTGSVKTGRYVSQVVARRFGKVILELGGNAAVVVTKHADVELALDAVLFGAIGTSGLRCTTVRRLILEETVAATNFVAKLADRYKHLEIGDPLHPKTDMGPLASEALVYNMEEALSEYQRQGATLFYGGRRIKRPGFFVEPALLLAKPDMSILKQEVFAPILPIIVCRDLDEAIEINNNSGPRLSSAIFTTRLDEAERFKGIEGSNCGMVSVNTSSSGAECWSAFGGEGETGGGREAGSDAWKQYMRRKTCISNFSGGLALAQGITVNK